MFYVMFFWSFVINVVSLVFWYSVGVKDFEFFGGVVFYDVVIFSIVIIF